MFGTALTDFTIAFIMCHIIAILIFCDWTCPNCFIWQNKPVCKSVSDEM